MPDLIEVKQKKILSSQLTGQLELLPARFEPRTFRVVQCLGGKGASHYVPPRCQGGEHKSSKIVSQDITLAHSLENVGKEYGTCVCAP